MELKQLELTGGAKLTVYLRTPSEAMPSALVRPLVLVVPGGGYNHVSPREGDPVALQFAAAGYHTAVLEYSVGDAAADFQPLRQISQAIGLVRTHAAAWGVEPEKIAVCGFSARGTPGFVQRCTHPAWGRGGGAAPAQCGRAGLSGDQRRCLCPPGQF